MKKPNILIIHTDQQRWDTIKANGNSLIKTPNIDRLAASGVNFDHCFSQNPVCMPSRISFMTGQYCSSLKITHMAVTVPENTITLQKILSNYGYYNGLIGKLHYQPHSNRDHRKLNPKYDFDHMELSDEPGCYEDAYRAWVRRKSPEELENISIGLSPVSQMWQKYLGHQDNIDHSKRFMNGELIKEATAYKSKRNLTHAAFVSEQTIEFLYNNKDKPFFCFSGFYSPHSPWVAPKEFLDMYDKENMPVPDFPADLQEKRVEAGCSDEEIKDITRGYYAMISEVDSWIGKILDTLDELEISDNTIIVFTSDHGEFLGEHLKYGKGFWAPDCISRVPLIIKVPKQLDGAASRNINDIVESVDVVPTLLEIAGIPVPPEVQGHFLPVTNSKKSFDKDGIGLTEYNGWRSMRFENYRYVIEMDGHERLFDLAKDPLEYNDVSDDDAYLNILNQARKSLIVRMLKIEQPLEREWPY